MNRPELLSPAGTLEKGLAALHFGADAVYCGLDRFSLRRHAGNLSLDDLNTLVKAAGEYGRKVYLATNIFPYDEDFAALRKVIGAAVDIGIDALILSDPGVLNLVMEMGVTVPLHLSTQANTLNALAVRFWMANGIRRIILARELSLRQIEDIASEVPGAELEIFAHGALCMAYSGRCFISRYLTGRDANRGDCSQGCRWTYRLEELKREEERYDVIEDEEGTRIFAARDLWTLPILPHLLSTGIHGLKIEGRMKSLYYVAVVTAVYRQALDCLVESECEFEGRLPEWSAELLAVPNRGYTTNFYLPAEDCPQPVTTPVVEGADVFLGIVQGVEDGWTFLEVKNTFDIYQELEIFSPGGADRVEIRDALNHRDEPVTRLHSGLTVRIRPSIPLEKGDILRLCIRGNQAS